MYALLRAIAGVALRWYYSDIHVQGIERIPQDRALLLVVNHPNALVDALLVGWVVPRRVSITAKSTLFTNPIAGWVLRMLGVVPLYRASDANGVGTGSRASHNRESFAAVHRALANGGTVLIFPEGKTHDDASLAPLKTGAARMAILAAQGDAPNAAIVPIGLVFERKDTPRTRVLVQVGEPILMERWRAPAAFEGSAADALTCEIDVRLRAVTLNYATPNDTTRAVQLAGLVAALFEDVPKIGVVDRNLGKEAAIARRIDDFKARFFSGSETLRLQADELARRLDVLKHVAESHGVMIEDVGISLRPAAAARFCLREGWLLAVAGPIALWGRLNHALPLRGARMMAGRSVESAADPAMRTLVAGTAFVLLTYLGQTLVVHALWGPRTALTYLASLPIAADISFTLSDRLRRARRRATAYLTFRRDPGLQQRLGSELDSLRTDVAALDRAASGKALVGTA